MSVDLPAPFSPTTARTSPRSICRHTSCKARTPGNALEIPVAVRRGGMRRFSDLFVAPKRSLDRRDFAHVLAILARPNVQHALPAFDGVGGVHLADEDRDLAPLGQRLLDQLPR